MRAKELVTGRFGSVAVIAALAMLLPLSAPSSTANSNSQDQTFRLMNIERRLDQLQIRVDAMERTLQNQAMSSTGSSNAPTQALLELQRQHLSLAEQVVTMHKRMLDMQKSIDQLASRGESQEKGEKPKEEAKPKAQPKKP